MTLTDEKAALLRKPFPKNAIGKLPRSTCQACSKSQRKRCDEHTWVSGCDECHGSHSSATMHLNYVGHAAVTDRLLLVDPGYTWRPFTAAEMLDLPPALREAGLWIHLTICGETKPGVGDGKNAKECIGDAIRNAAMRFGVALDLWGKDELEQISTYGERLRANIAAATASGTSALRAALEKPAGDEHDPTVDPEWKGGAA